MKAPNPVSSTSQEVANFVTDLGSLNSQQRESLRTYINAGCPTLNNVSGFDQARLILGNSFFSCEEMFAGFGFTYSQEEVLKYERYCSNLQTLLWLLANSYVLLPIPNQKLTLPELYSRFRQLFKATNPWYLNEYENSHARLEFPTPSRVLAIRKVATPNSIAKTYVEGKSALSTFETVPDAASLVLACIAHQRLRKEQILLNAYLTTKTIDNRGTQICVGLFDDQISVSNDHDSRKPSNNVGVATQLTADEAPRLSAYATSFIAQDHNLMIESYRG